MIIREFDCTPGGIMAFRAVCIMSGLVLTAILSSGCGGADKLAQERTEKTRTENALNECHTLVAETLLSPANAQWPSTNPMPSGTSESGWTITGSVDSQNLFGALLRTEFECTATYDKATDVISVHRVKPE